MTQLPALYSLKQLCSGTQWPRIHGGTHHETCAELSLGIGENLHWFKGHFPEQPVVPGVVQTHWVGVFSRHLFSINQAFAKITNVKFNTVMLPQTQTRLRLIYRPERHSVNFTFENDSTLYSSGTLHFSHPSN
ncbi:MAG: hypothetical protein KTR20_13150 [Cellvibrionaceae bacterium]|nr:hypothetical protein [Cellvibrionaceae bacterium]